MYLASQSYATSRRETTLPISEYSPNFVMYMFSFLKTQSHLNVFTIPLITYHQWISSEMQFVIKLYKM